MVRAQAIRDRSRGSDRLAGLALTIAFVAIVVGLGLLLKDRPAALVASLILPTLAFLVVAIKTTRGGWRWRNRRDQ